MSIEKLQLKINSILGGFSPTFLLSAQDQYLAGVSIDPEASGSIGGITGHALGGVKPIRSQAVLSTSSLGEAPMWMGGSINTSGAFVYGSSGTLYALTSTLGLQSDGGEVKPTSGAGNGMAVYGDYVYCATPTDIFRYGRLSVTAPILQSCWVTGVSSGSAQTTLANPTYPGIRSVDYPNHVLFVHNDGYMYIADYDTSAVESLYGALIHRILVRSDGEFIAMEYAKLKLPPGYIPMAFESYGTDLAILCSSSQVSGGTIKGGNSALFLWDTISQTFYRNIPINEPIATAMKNKNGELFITAGNIESGVKLLKYLGGYSFQTVVSLEEGTPPPAGAIDVLGNMLVFGGYVTTPNAQAGILSVGYRSGKLPTNALNFPMRSLDTSGTLPIVTCVKFLSRSNYPLLGWRASSAFGLDQAGGTGSFSARFLAKVFNIGKPFKIKRIRIPLTSAVIAGTTIIPTVYVDNQGSSVDLKTINTTNFPNSEKLIDYNSISIDGKTNFYIDFQFDGTTPVGFVFPITIDIETEDL